MDSDVRVEPKLATVDGLPGRRDWGARACLGAAMAEITDAHSVIVLVCDKDPSVTPCMYSANTTHERATYLLSRQLHRICETLK